jgi:hypothetical protein
MQQGKHRTKKKRTRREEMSHSWMGHTCLAALEHGSVGSNPTRIQIYDRIVLTCVKNALCT